MSKVIVIGHKNPDTDSIMSAIGAQEYFAKVLKQDAQAFRAGEINNETKFVLEHFGVEIPQLVGQVQEGERVALVDHNEKSQVFDGLDYNFVEYIFDHHKLAIVTEQPIFVRAEVIGSTSSLVAKMLLEKGIEPTEKTAKVLLAGILSDTLNFTSPTTTEEDKELAAKLNEIAKIEIESFVAEMFKAKSSLEGIETKEIISLDYKTFEMGACQVGVGTWETTFPESVNEKQAEIAKALEEKKTAEKLDYIFFMVVDILQQVCQLYVIGQKEQELAEKVFGGKVENQMLVLPGVVSRKKQIIPPLTEALSK